MRSGCGAEAGVPTKRKSKGHEAGVLGSGGSAGSHSSDWDIMGMGNDIIEAALLDDEATVNKSTCSAAAKTVAAVGLAGNKRDDQKIAIDTSKSGLGHLLEPLESIKFSDGSCSHLQSGDVAPHRTFSGLSTAPARSELSVILNDACEEYGPVKVVAPPSPTLHDRVRLIQEQVDALTDEELMSPVGMQRLSHSLQPLSSTHSQLLSAHAAGTDGDNTAMYRPQLSHMSSGYSNASNSHVGPIISNNNAHSAWNPLGSGGSGGHYTQNAPWSPSTDPMQASGASQVSNLLVTNSTSIARHSAGYSPNNKHLSRSGSTAAGHRHHSQSGSTVVGHVQQSNSQGYLANLLDSNTATGAAGTGEPQVSTLHFGRTSAPANHNSQRSLLPPRSPAPADHPPKSTQSANAPRVPNSPNPASTHINGSLSPRSDAPQRPQTMPHPHTSDSPTPKFDILTALHKFTSETAPLSAPSSSSPSLGRLSEPNPRGTAHKTQSSTQHRGNAARTQSSAQAGDSGGHAQLPKQGQGFHSKSLPPAGRHDSPTKVEGSIPPTFEHMLAVKDAQQPASPQQRVQSWHVKLAEMFRKQEKIPNSQLGPSLLGEEDRSSSGKEQSSSARPHSSQDMKHTSYQGHKLTEMPSTFSSPAGSDYRLPKVAATDSAADSRPPQGLHNNVTFRTSTTDHTSSLNSTFSSSPRPSPQIRQPLPSKPQQQQQPNTAKGEHPLPVQPVTAATAKGTPPGHYYHFMDSLTRLQQQQDEQQQQQQTQKERSLPRQQLVHSSTNYTVTEQSSLPMQVQEDPFLQWTHSSCQTQSIHTDPAPDPKAPLLNQGNLQAPPNWGKPADHSHRHSSHGGSQSTAVDLAASSDSLFDQAALTHRNVQRLNLWQHSGAPFKRNAHFMGSAEGMMGSYAPHEGASGVPSSQPSSSQQPQLQLQSGSHVQTMSQSHTANLKAQEVLREMLEPPRFFGRTSPSTSWLKSNEAASRSNTSVPQSSSDCALPPSGPSQGSGHSSTDEHAAAMAAAHSNHSNTTLTSHTGAGVLASLADDPRSAGLNEEDVVHLQVVYSKLALRSQNRHSTDRQVDGLVRGRTEGSHSQGHHGKGKAAGPLPSPFHAHASRSLLSDTSPPPSQRQSYNSSVTHLTDLSGTSAPLSEPWPASQGTQHTDRSQSGHSQPNMLQRMALEAALPQQQPQLSSNSWAASQTHSGAAGPLNLGGYSGVASEGGRSSSKASGVHSSHQPPVSLVPGGVDLGKAMAGQQMLPLSSPHQQGSQHNHSGQQGQGIAAGEAMRGSTYSAESVAGGGLRLRSSVHSSQHGVGATGQHSRELGGVVSLSRQTSSCLSNPASSDGLMQWQRGDSGSFAFPMTPPSSAGSVQVLLVVAGCVIALFNALMIVLVLFNADPHPRHPA